MTHANSAKVILVVEDDKEIADILQLILTERGYGVHLLLSVDPDQALELKADLIILDLWLKGFKGSELCERLKKDERTSFIPVILCSAVMNLPGIQQSCQADAFI